MSKQDKLEKQIIDDYYKKRESDSSDIMLDNMGDGFAKKLHSSMSKMDVLTEDNFDLDINIMEIISKGEKVRNKASDTKEFIKFILSAILILTTLILLTVLINHNIFIYWQLIVFFIIPFTLIPLAKLSLSKEGS